MTTKMREILFDWMWELSQEIGFRRQTYYLALNYTDRFLSLVNDVPRRFIQLAGLTALFIAQKFEEIEPKRIENFIVSAAESYSRDQILSLERHMIKTLGYYLFPETQDQTLNFILLSWDRLAVQNSESVCFFSSSKTTFFSCLKNT
jgi:hypothetical protein